MKNFGVTSFLTKKTDFFKLWYVKDKQEPEVIQTNVTKAENNDKNNKKAEITDKNNKKLVVEEKKSLVQRLYDQGECQFMVTMDKSAEHTYHIGKISMLFAIT